MNKSTFRSSYESENSAIFSVANKDDTADATKNQDKSVKSSYMITD